MASTPNVIVCLSLESREDRWNQILVGISTSHLLSQVPLRRHIARPPDQFIIPHWWPAKEHPRYYACCRDQLEIIESAYVRGFSSILILEDDAVIHQNFDQIFRAAVDDLPADWMGLWLGGEHHVRPEFVTDNLVRCKAQGRTHAYMLSRPGMRKVFSHVTAQHTKVMDWATLDLHGRVPHFYATPIEVVSQSSIEEDRRRRKNAR